MNIIEKVIILAMKAHQNQVRKGTDIPYVTHPYMVGMILAKERCEEEVIAAGILHDTVEDTHVRLDEIEKDFGYKVAQIVRDCSEPYKDLPWENRKEHTLEFLKTAPKEVRLVSCADKLHNVQSILKDYDRVGEKVWERFNRGKGQQEWYYRGLVESLGYQSRFPLLNELQEQVDILFGSKTTDHEWMAYKYDPRFFDRLFENLYSEKKYKDKKLKQLVDKLHIRKLLVELYQRVGDIRENLHSDQFSEMSHYLYSRGIEFAQSEGTEIVIAFCVAIKEKFGLYNHQVYHYLIRNEV